MEKAKKFLAIIFMCMLPLMLSCGGGGGGGGEAPPPTVDVTGTWSGTWASSNDIDHGNLSATLTQSGASVSGTVSITESPCISSGSVSGTVSENNVGFGVVSGTDTITYTATSTSSSMSGTYSVTTGECAGDTGTFSMTKQVQASTICFSVSGCFVTIYNMWSDGSSQTSPELCNLVAGGTADSTWSHGSETHHIVYSQMSLLPPFTLVLDPEMLFISIDEQPNTGFLKVSDNLCS